MPDTPTYKSTLTGPELDEALRNIGNTIAEPLDIHKVGDAASRRDRVRELLDQVSLPQSLL